MKRVFTDADIYEDEWYQELSCNQKIFWDYICRRAEYGFWKPNVSLAQFNLKISISLDEMLKAFNREGFLDETIKERVRVLDNGRWFIPSWVPFQYKNLSIDCKAHKPVFDYYKLNYPALFYSYLIAIGYQQEKEKDTEKEEVKEIKGIVKGGFKKPSPEELKELFVGKGFPAEAEKFFGHYEANGWRVGRNPMRSVQHAAANWIRNIGAYGKAEALPAVKREKKPNPACTACGGKGKLLDRPAVSCWCPS